jgi:hypothetical protein
MESPSIDETPKSQNATSTDPGKTKHSNNWHRSQIGISKITAEFRNFLTGSGPVIEQALVAKRPGLAEVARWICS